MQQAYPPITDEHRQHLAKQGLKVYQPDTLDPFVNPFHTHYWVANALMLGVSVLGRRHAGKIGGPRTFWSAAILAVPISAIIGRTRLDTLDEIAGARKTLEQKLENAPITRRAWERALETNAEYQNQLQEQIKQLKIEIAKKESAK